MCEFLFKHKGSGIFGGRIETKSFELRVCLVYPNINFYTKNKSSTLYLGLSEVQTIRGFPTGS